jgi:hypothetical protein
MSVNKKIFSIDSDDDDDVPYEAFIMHLHEDTQRKLKKATVDISKSGDDYLREIEQKKVRNNVLKAKYVKYIMKHNKGIYNAEILMSYELSDVFYMYNELRESRKSRLKNFFQFLFNI